MSLLEGHADVVMDRVGPEVIPTVAAIRDKFTVRRQGQGFDKVIRKLLGLDAKMRQYRDGAVFCQDGDRPGRDGRTEQGLDLAEHPAHPRRDRRPRALAVPGSSRAGDALADARSEVAAAHGDAA